MKPCRKYRKQIAWLAAGSLETPAARNLRSHLEICEGCRAYFQEISHLAQTLNATAITPDMDASESFHRRVAGALRVEASASVWERAGAFLRAGLSNGRMALPALAVLVLAAATLFHFQRHAAVLTPGPAIAPAVPAANMPGDLRPSIRNYQIAACCSLDQLDELLARQANRRSSFVPPYTASAFARAMGPD